MPQFCVRLPTPDTIGHHFSGCKPMVQIPFLQKYCCIMQKRRKPWLGSLLSPNAYCSIDLIALGCASEGRSICRTWRPNSKWAYTFLTPVYLCLRCLLPVFTHLQQKTNFRFFCSYQFSPEQKTCNNGRLEMYCITFNLKGLSLKLLFFVMSKWFDFGQWGIHQNGQCHSWSSMEKGNFTLKLPTSASDRIWNASPKELLLCPQSPDFYGMPGQYRSAY